jgi:hypothetical protein
MESLRRSVNRLYERYVTMLERTGNYPAELRAKDDRVRAEESLLYQFWYFSDEAVAKRIKEKPETAQVPPVDRKAEMANWLRDHDLWTKETYGEDGDDQAEDPGPCDHGDTPPSTA